MKLNMQGYMRLNRYTHHSRHRRQMNVALPTIYLLQTCAYFMHDSGFVNPVIADRCAPQVFTFYSVYGQYLGLCSTIRYGPISTYEYSLISIQYCQYVPRGHVVDSCTCLSAADICAVRLNIVLINLFRYSVVVYRHYYSLCYDCNHNVSQQKNGMDTQSF